MHVDECLCRVWRRSLDGMLYQGCVDLPGGSAAVEVERGFLCYECGCALATVGAWRTHRAGYMAPDTLPGLWRLAPCAMVNCMEFHSRPRLLCHLMYSVSACLDAYAAFFVPCDDATVETPELADRLESRALRKAGEYDRVALIPAVRVHGCVLPLAARGPDDPGEVVPPGVPDGHDGRAQRTPVPVHRYTWK